MLLLYTPPLIVALIAGVLLSEGLYFAGCIFGGVAALSWVIIFASVRLAARGLQTDETFPTTIPQLDAELARAAEQMRTPGVVTGRVLQASGIAAYTTVRRGQTIVWFSPMLLDELDDEERRALLLRSLAGVAEGRTLRMQKIVGASNPLSLLIGRVPKPGGSRLARSVQRRAISQSMLFELDMYAVGMGADPAALASAYRMCGGAPQAAIAESMSILAVTPIDTDAVAADWGRSLTAHRLSALEALAGNRRRRRGAPGRLCARAGSMYEQEDLTLYDDDAMVAAPLAPAAFPRLAGEVFLEDLAGPVASVASTPAPSAVTDVNPYVESDDAALAPPVSSDDQWAAVDAMFQVSSPAPDADPAPEAGEELQFVPDLLDDAAAPPAFSVPVSADTAPLLDWTGPVQIGGSESLASTIDEAELLPDDDESVAGDLEPTEQPAESGRSMRRSKTP